MPHFQPTLALLQELKKRLAPLDAAHEASWILEACEHHPQPQKRLEEILERRGQQEPLAYILGSWSFWGREFAVGPGVLIPRPETEELVERCLPRLLQESHSDSAVSLLDAGAGTGCIGITLGWELLKASPVNHWSIHYAEASPKALPYLKQNCTHWKNPSLSFHIHADRWQALKIPESSLTAVVSNPPYVSTSEFETLTEPAVKNFEPLSALLPEDIATDPSASGPYRDLLNRAGKWLKPGGWLCLELGPTQAPHILSWAAEQSPLWINAALENDLAGHPRFAFFQKSTLMTEKLSHG